MPSRMFQFCCALRTTMSIALPSMMAWMKLPRWLRLSDSRSQSRNATPKNNAADPTPMRSTRCHVIRSPRIDSTR